MTAKYAYASTDRTRVNKHTARTLLHTHIHTQYTCTHAHMRMHMQWAAAFVSHSAQGVATAGVPDLVTLLAALPRMTAGLSADSEAASNARALAGACVSRIGAGVAQLELPALADLLDAVSGGGSSSSGSGASARAGQAAGGNGIAVALAQSGEGSRAGSPVTGAPPHVFVGAVLEASEAKLAGADMATLTRLAAAVAQVGASCVCVNVCVCV